MIYSKIFKDPLWPNAPRGLRRTQNDIF